MKFEFSGQDLLPKELRASLRAKRSNLAKIWIDKKVSVLFVTDIEIQALNKQWRGKNKPTDVLSFSAQEGHAMPGLENILGDVVISVDRALAQARQYGHGFEEEICVLLVHGITHLLGHDHAKNETEASRQMDLEMQLLESIGIDKTLALCGRINPEV